MTSKLVVNNIEADAGVSTVTFGSEISASTFTGNLTGNVTGNLTGNVTSSSTSTFSSGLNVTGGSVGIGTDNPSGNFDIFNTSRIKHVAASNINHIEFWKDLTPTYAASIGLGVPAVGSLNQDLTFSTYVNGGSWNERLRITSGGLVGIGTTNPLGLGVLAVSGGVSNPAITFQNGSAINTASDALVGSIVGYSRTTGGNINIGSVDIRTDIASASSGAVRILTASNGVLAETLRVDSSGNVTVSNGNLVFSTSGTGIDFSATSDGSGTATSELLDDYEEGTWTPSVFFGATASTVSSNGKYTKIGNLVHITYQVTINNLNGGSGAIAVGGLPYAPSQSPTYSHGNCQGNTNQTLPTGAGSIQPYIEHAVSTFRLLYMTNNSHADITQAHFPAGVTFYGDGDYYTA